MRISPYFKITCGCVRCNPAAERLEALSWEPRYSCTSQTWQAWIHRSQSSPNFPPSGPPTLAPDQAQLVFRSNSETPTSGCATARDRTRVREAPPALPVFVTKPQKNSDNPPRGVSASPVKDSEIKAIMGSGDCAESKLRPVTMHRENIFLARLENTGGCSSCLPTPKRIH